MRISRKLSLTLVPGLLLAALATAVAALTFTAAPALAAPISPTVTIKPVGTVTTTTALLSGTVNPNGSPTTTVWNFQYSKDPGTEGWTPSAVSGIATASEEVSGTVEGLQPNATYQVRLFAFNEEGGEGVSAEPNPKFTTKPVPPVVVGESAPVVTVKDASLAAQINPNNEETSYAFEYSPEGSVSGNTLEGPIVKVPGGSIPAGFGETPAGPVGLGDVLTPGTPYFYRVVATNNAGTTDGPVQEFTTKTPSESPAKAATPSPGWAIDSVAAPTNFSAKEGGAYQLEVTNAGSEPTRLYAPGEPKAGEPIPIVIEDTVPSGLTVTANSLGCPETARVVRCEDDEVVAPDQSVRFVVDVSVNTPSVSGPLTNEVEVSGGGAPTVEGSSENQISEALPPFGLSNFDFAISGVNGAGDTQAGDHPYEVTTTLDLNDVVAVKNEENPVPTSVQDLKDVVVDLPLGFAGSTLAAPECTLAQLSSAKEGSVEGEVAPGTGCPSETVVGHIRTEPIGAVTHINSPIWNLVPEHGYPAEFGYIDGKENTHVFYVRVVPTPRGYVLQTTNSEIPQVPLEHIVVSFYGDPAQRDGTSHAQVPFFTNPSDCAPNPVTGNPEPLTASAWVDSWQNPGRYNPDGTPNLEGDASAWIKATSTSPPVTGCDELSFAPKLEAQPTTHQADTPSGLDFALNLPQTEDVGVHATPALKNATIVLPEGMTVDPSSGNGLGACSQGEIGWEGPTLFDFNAAPPACPEASKIGSLELETPLIPGVLHGEMFLAAQNANPFGSTLAGYIVVNDPITGVVLKIAGELKTNPATGQITGVFDENPQLPFSDLKLHFFGGPRAELATPTSCGSYRTGSALTPWSALENELPSSPFDDYTIDEDCATGFAPSFAAGTPNVQAGAYTPFQASFSREDTDQELGGLTVSLPPGLLADVASVPLCGEAQANAGTCPESTQVGTVLAEAGPGPNPLAVPGKVYLTGPYNGGPYGLSVVTPAIAGPFNFGLVVVRQSLRIDPLTAAVTDVSNPFPTILDVTGQDGQTDGIPIKLRRIDVNIDRAGFAFNPTNCGKLQVGGAITSTQGQSRALEVPFQVTDCANLKFAPKFTVSTSGKTSKALGASLTARVTYGRAGISFPQGTYADVAKVKVELPKALPSRLTTLQKACTAAQFEANPAGCPSASKIGHATVHTPILAGALTGPAIFVSHGGEAFPSLEIVLQGDGVTIDLVGATFISKSGITSTTFKTVPDAPFTSFELTLPEGKYSALAANGNLCAPTTTKTVKKKLTVEVHGHKRTVTRKVTEKVAGALEMPNDFIAQNGAEIHETTQIAVIGCPPARSKAKPAKKTKKTKREPKRKK